MINWIKQRIHVFYCLLQKQDALLHIIGSIINKPIINTCICLIIKNIISHCLCPSVFAVSVYLSTLCIFLSCSLGSPGTSLNTWTDAPRGSCVLCRVQPTARQICRQKQRGEPPRRFSYVSLAGGGPRPRPGLRQWEVRGYVVCKHMPEMHIWHAHAQIYHACTSDARMHNYVMHAHLTRACTTMPCVHKFAVDAHLTRACTTIPCMHIWRSHAQLCHACISLP